MKTVVELPNEVLVAARRSPEEVAGDMRLALAAYWYDQALVSQGMAARIAGLSRRDFIRALSRLGISPLQGVADDLEAIKDE